MLKNYIKQLFQTYQSGAREESYYPALKSFLEEYSQTNRKKKIEVTVLPPKTEAGNPDFRLRDNKQKIIGYIEAKDLGVNLDIIEDSLQLKRYFSTFPNVILTNFTEFRLYRDGEMIDKVSITRPFVIKKLSTVPPLENEDKLSALLERFLDFSLPTKFTAKTLAVELAKRTKFLKDEIVAEELKAGTKSIHGFYEAFQKFLIAGIDEDEFADLYSQTITYGLFAARLRAGDDFNRTLAFSYIPKSIGILRDIFRFISMEDIPKQMEIIIDDIAEVLSCANPKTILDEYYHKGKGSDPVLHFYETFLSEYDPSTREKRGVYYTPEPVVSFIVRSLHEILKDKFNLNEGLASKNVTLLDPAGGTLGFIYQAIEVAVNEFKEKYGDGSIESFLKERVLQNFYAFELMMAPYAIGHMKISFLLDELGYKMKDDERVKYYLTNTLDMQELDESKFPGMSSLSHESHEAGKVKKEIPILVVLGNPPYSVSSSNIIKEGSELHLIYEGYKDSVRKVEKNIQPLSDDYIKFIAFAHYKLSQVEQGIVGMITNNSYLSGVIHRGIRLKLLEDFSEIFVLNLHGNSRIAERNPLGGKDENVFDIQAGISIVFFVKVKNKKQNPGVFIFNLWGTREEKYSYLLKNNFYSIDWKKLDPTEPYYFFIEKDFSNKTSYDNGISIENIFNLFSSGVKTNRDHFLVDISASKLKKRISDLLSRKIDDELFNKTYNLIDGTYWNTKREREKLRQNENWENQFYPYSYRPFDLRWIYYQPNLIEIKRGGASKEIMRNFFNPNIALINTRILSTNKFYHSFVTEAISDMSLISLKTKESSYIFPLYFFPNSDKKDLFSDHESNEKKPNIKPEIFEQLNKMYSTSPSIPLLAKERGRGEVAVTPEEIFYYIYAILYSNTYRSKYSEFLKIDFPRVPFTKDYKLFIKLGKLGKELADLHLLKIKTFPKNISFYPQKGNNKVEKLKYEDEKVWINKVQYFSNVKPEVWEYQIGGYQVCEKWLKDRKGRTLNVDDIQTYCQIVTALSKTIELQKEIDKNYEGVEK